MQIKSAVRLSGLFFALFAFTFSLAVSVQAQTETTIHSFNNDTNGYNPVSSLILDSSGNLYSTTTAGGNFWGCIVGCGVAFELSPGSGGSWSESLLHTFNGGVDGADPYVGLIEDGAGNFYGASAYRADTRINSIGNGAIVELSPSSGGWMENTIHVFTGGPDGAYPFGSLILDSAGNLYGTTSYGGDPSCNCGVAFEFTPTSTGWKEIILHTFTGPDGERPVANMIFDSSGNLYGTTEFSATGAGVVFKLSPGAGGAWSETVLYQFTDGADGGIPVSGVIFDTAGNLYGTASDGGNSSNCGYSGCGVVYKLSPRPVGPWRETVLHSFDYLDGAYPQAALVFDAAGNLYSTAYDGSRSRCGVVFELSPRSGGGWVDSTTYAFTCGDDGANPHSALAIDGAGNLYGTTQFGGVNNRGAVYEITP